MKKKTGVPNSFGVRFLNLILILGLILIGIDQSCADGDTACPESNTIRVGLYHWAPNVEQFKFAIRNAWNEKHPDVSLEFAGFDEWDGGYMSDPTDNLDVFAFDTIFLSLFMKQGYLNPIKDSEVEGLSDFLPFLIDGSKADGKLWGIPQVTSPHVFFYRKGDTELEQVSSLSDMVKFLGTCSYIEEKPPENKGLGIALYDDSLIAILYIEALQDIHGVYTTEPSLPFEAAKLDNQAITDLRRIASMSSMKNARYYQKEPYNEYVQARWFSDGHGRATFGFTDSLSVMSRETVRNVRFKPMPLSDRGKIPPYWTVIIGINSKTEIRAMAIKLANLIASPDVLVKSIGGTGRSEHGHQYLMPSRPSAFEKLISMSSHYEAMYQLAKDADSKVLRFGPNVKKWLGQMKGTITQRVFGEPVCPDENGE
ncbi:thiamine pyridinylase [Desulfococcaceae bacterium HSG8]|nr:thiamine pyridinylase [Desulfococcaceae bacterium HSG8]